MFTLLLPMLCLFLLLFVFYKHYGKKNFQQTLLKQYEQYKIENPKLRLIRFWAFVAGALCDNLFKCGCFLIISPPVVAHQLLCRW